MESETSFYFYTPYAQNLKFHIPDDQKSKDTFISKCVYNDHQTLLMRRSVNNEENTEKHLTEVDFLMMGIPNVVEFNSYLVSSDHWYTLMVDPGVKLSDYLIGCKWDPDTSKLILLKVGELINDLHKMKKCGVDRKLFDNIYLKGSRAHDLSVKVTNFYDIHSYEENENDPEILRDINSFKDLAVQVFTQGLIQDCTTLNMSEILNSRYYDSVTLFDLHQKISNGMNAMSDILLHPVFWTNQKALEFFDRVYVLTTFGYNNIDLNSYNIFSSNWDSCLGPDLQKFAIHLHEKAIAMAEARKRAEEERERKISENSSLKIQAKVQGSEAVTGIAQDEKRKQDVDITTLNGLIAFIRHTCRTHFFNQWIDVRRILGPPPFGIMTFIARFPRLVVNVYRDAQPRADVAIQREIMEEFYPSVDAEE